MAKAGTAFRTIGEVAETLDVPQHVLRFWETRFPQVAPRKSGSGRRYYRPDDVALLAAIRKLLYVDGYTIKGVQRVLRSQGVQALRAGVAQVEPESDGLRPGDQPLADDPDLSVPPLMEPRSEPLQERLSALADMLDDCARTLADARSRAMATP